MLNSEGLLGLVCIATSTTEAPEALVSHDHALLTPAERLRLARCVDEDGWPAVTARWRRQRRA
ncbi:hypothetical protein DIZ27_33120 [Streptomyces sp. NWU339]|nr:hypothetical protein DIZ27_33120 [Streptomyces sp. NWU339]